MTERIVIGLSFTNRELGWSKVDEMIAERDIDTLRHLTTALGMKVELRVWIYVTQFAHYISTTEIPAFMLESGADAVNVALWHEFKSEA